MDKNDQAKANLQALFKNPYPGRGIVVGLDEEGNIIMVYWIMGRSENSRNRVFTLTGECLSTAPANPATAGDTSLIIYDAMIATTQGHVVSNGQQTNVLAGEIAVAQNIGEAIKVALERYQYEPDPPNFTPRISAFCRTGHDEGSRFFLSMLRKADERNECERHFWEPSDITPGFGYMITTYASDGNPLPSFTGPPLLMPLQGNMIEIQDAFWHALNPDHRISIAVRKISADGRVDTIIRNKYQQV